MEEIVSAIQQNRYLYWEDNAARITVPVFYSDSLLAGVIGISFFNRKYDSDAINTLLQEVLTSAEAISGVI